MYFGGLYCVTILFNYSNLAFELYLTVASSSSVNVKMNQINLINHKPKINYRCKYWRWQICWNCGKPFPHPLPTLVIYSTTRDFSICMEIKLWGRIHAISLLCSRLNMYQPRFKWLNRTLSSREYHCLSADGFSNKTVRTISPSDYLHKHTRNVTIDWDQLVERHEWFYVSNERARA